MKGFTSALLALLVFISFGTARAADPAPGGSDATSTGQAEGKDTTGSGTTGGDGETNADGADSDDEPDCDD